MKALIFGCNGQDGVYLSNLLKSLNIEVIGISRNKYDLNKNIHNFDYIREIIQLHLPEFIFHFSAKSSTSHEYLFENHDSITNGVLNLLEAVRIFCGKTKVFISGSALQFENNGNPIDENKPFHASSAYSLARINSIYIARYYREKFNLKIYVGYLFNHDSPLRGDHHINKFIVNEIKLIKKGQSRKIYIGNLKVKKEFNFAGDIVNAIWILINQESIYEVVIGSGITHSIEDWVNYCFYKSNLDPLEYVFLKQGFMSEYEILVSNPYKIKSLGWIPRLNFYQLADLMLE